MDDLNGFFLPYS